MLYRQDHQSLEVMWEPGDKPPYTESAFWFMLKRAMNKQGHDMIKKCPDKDGHMTGSPFYLRDRKWRYCIHDGHYVVRDLARDFRSKEPVYLEIHGEFPGIIVP